jgi:hypothetical protein
MKFNTVIPSPTLIASIIGALCSVFLIPITAQNTDADFEIAMEAEVRALAQAKPIHLVSLLYLRNPAIENSKYERAISHFYASEERDFRINAYAGSISRSIRYDGGSEFVLFDKQLNEEGEEVRIPKIRIDLGRPGPKILVLTTNSEDNLIGRVLPTDERNFAKNAVRIFNFSTQPVKVQVQDTSKEIGQMAIEDFAVKMDKPRAMIAFTVAAYANGNGYLVARKRIGMPNGGRKFIVLFPSPTNPDQLTFTNLSINSGPLVDNYSDEEVRETDSDYYDSYIPAAQR